MQIPNNNNLPPIVEVTTISQKQLIPVNFVQLKSQPGNNWCSTEGRINKPPCQRYMFSYQDKEFYLDITYEVMASLDLSREGDFPYPLYIDSSILIREQVGLGITISNSEDIIIVKPGTFLEREVQTDEDNRISELEKENNTQEELLEIKNNRIVNLVDDYKKKKERIRK